MSRKFGHSFDPKDFEEVLKILEGGFIQINSSRVSFINPSLRDYLNEYLNDVQLLQEFAACARRADWADRLWRFASSLSFEQDELRNIAASFREFAPKLTTLPTWKSIPTDHGSYQVDDLPNSDRLKLLLSWWNVTRDISFADVTRSLADKPVRGFDPWRDGRDLVELIAELKDGDHFPEFPYADDVVQSLATGLVSILEGGLATDDLESIASSIDNYESVMPEEVMSALSYAVDQEFGGMTMTISDLDSDSSLDEYMSSLKKLAPRGNVGQAELDRAQERVNERAAELEESTSSSEPPSLTGPRTEKDVFSDAELKSLFVSLLAD